MRKPTGSKACGGSLPSTAWLRATNRAVVSTAMAEQTDDELTAASPLPKSKVFQSSVQKELKRRGLTPTTAWSRPLREQQQGSPPRQRRGLQLRCSRHREFEPETCLRLCWRRPKQPSCSRRRDWLTPKR